jgi:hypothetical protein
MAIRYQHTQRGTLMVAGLGIGAVVVALAGHINPVPAVGRLLGIMALGFAGMAWLFSSLTVEVDEQELRWHFGPGLWTYRLPLADIESAAPVRNTWLNGFGIRMRPGFRLYNVSGLDAVELRLRDGGIRRIGTDEPQALAHALNPARVP